MVSDVEYPVDSKGRNIYQHLDYDRITNAEVSLQPNDSLVDYHLTARFKDSMEIMMHWILWLMM